MLFEVVCILVFPYFNSKIDIVITVLQKGLQFRKCFYDKENMNFFGNIQNYLILFDIVCRKVLKPDTSV